ncbi:unnamed protein product, partial [Adineta steineri]
LKENASICDDIKQIVKVSVVTIANGNDNETDHIWHSYYFTNKF